MENPIVMSNCGTGVRILRPDVSVRPRMLCYCPLLTSIDSNSFEFRMKYSWGNKMRFHHTLKTQLYLPWCEAKIQIKERSWKGESYHWSLPCILQKLLWLLYMWFICKLFLLLNNDFPIKIMHFSDQVIVSYHL